MSTDSAAAPRRGSASPVHPITRLHAALARIPDDLIALLARISLAVTFWTSGQTKIEGFVLDPVGFSFEAGVPRLSESAVELFRSEYALPVLPPETAALLAAVTEHVLPALLFVGLATRLSALGLLAMTLVIQLFVYPAAYATHGLWAALALLLMARGAGRASLDHLLARRT